MRLLLFATTIDSALNYIRSKQQQVQNKRLSLDSATAGNDDDDNRSNDDNGQLTRAEGRQTVF
jgi:hypothetical protein